MELDILKVMSLLIVFVSLVLAAFLLTVKSENRVSNYLLSAFLIVTAIDSDSNFLGPYIYTNLPGLGMFLSSMVFLKLPFLFLYILSVTSSGFSLKQKHLLHTIPFIIIFLVFLPRFYLVDFDDKTAYLEANTLSDRLLEVQISYILVHSQILVYFVLIFRAIFRYKTILLENYSNASLFNYNWLFQMAGIFALESALATLKNLFMFFGSEDAYFYSMLITMSVALFYTIWLVMRALRYPELFRGVEPDLELVSQLIIKDQKAQVLYPQKNAHDDEINKQIIALEKLMKEEEPYLDPSLSIYELAKMTELSTKELSVLINHHLNLHFFDYVNRFRIEKAMEILRTPANYKLTVLEILYDVGFNSKSSFNTAFKKHTQQTPTEYRKMHLTSAA